MSESSGVSLGYHNIALLDEIVYGEITKKFFVFRSTCRHGFLIVYQHMDIAYLIPSDSTITFKENTYMVKEDNERFIVTIQKFGVTTESVTVSIRTRAANPTSTTRMYILYM